MDKADRKLVAWWALLILLTLLSFEGGLQWLGHAQIGTIIVILIALFKIRIVVLHFMEVAEAPWVLRGPLELWVLLLGVALIGLWHGYAV